MRDDSGWHIVWLSSDSLLFMLCPHLEMENIRMRNEEFELLLSMLDRREVGQKDQLVAALAAG